MFIKHYLWINEECISHIDKRYVTVGKPFS